MADNIETLISLFGTFDNLDEPMPSWNKASTIIPTLIVFLVITYICVIFRLYTRFHIIRSTGWDDLFVILVLLSGTGGTVCICLSTQYGLGQHFLNLEFSHMQTYLQLFYTANATYAMSTALVKLALLLQYLRIFKQGILRYTCIAVAVLTAMWGIPNTFMAWFPCFPVSGYWDFTSKAKCYAYGSKDRTTFYMTYNSASAINMILDIIILIIPIPLYFRKDASGRTKLGLLGLLLMGVLVNFLSIWRAATIVEHRATTYPTFDPTWYGAISIFLATLEVDVATICASVPVFWPVLTSKLDEIFVTREIKIERTHRFSAMEDEYELRRESTGHDSANRLHIHVEPKSNIHGSELRDVQAPGCTHYKDSYVRAQVNPLSPTGRIEAEITAQKGLGRSKSLLQ